MFQVRQGDILFEAVNNVPKGLKKLQTNVLAYGEVTGHAHKIVSPSTDQLDMFSDENGDIYVMSKGGEVTVDHEEHGAITLPENTWLCVSRQREFDPLAADKERRVAD